MPFSDKGGISPEAINEMLKLASKKLGMTPEQLKSTISDPQKANILLQKLDKNNNGKVKSAVNDPKALEDLINSNPKAKKLLNDLLGDKKDG